MSIVQMSLWNHTNAMILNYGLLVHKFQKIYFPALFIDLFHRLNMLIDIQTSPQKLIQMYMDKKMI